MIKAISILIVVSLLSIRSKGQTPAVSWYYISTEKLYKFSLMGEEMKWTHADFEGNELGEKNNTVQLLSVMTEGQKIGFIYQESDSSNTLLYGLTFFRLAPDSSYMDMEMECSVEGYAETSSFRKVWQDCAQQKGLFMRYYSEQVIRQFKQLPAISNMSPEEAAEVKRQFEQEKKLLVKKLGEDKLLWVAPVIFQQILTDLLLKKGFSPFFSHEQAVELFDFHFY